MFSGDNVGHKKHRRVCGAFLAANIVGACIYLGLTAIAPSRFLGGMLILWGLFFLSVVLAISTGVLLVSPKVWAWRLGVGACWAILGIEMLLIVLLLSGAVFLWGSYGSFGMGASVITLVLALLSFQIVALIPVLQLWSLRRGYLSKVLN